MKAEFLVEIVSQKGLEVLADGYVSNGVIRPGTLFRGVKRRVGESQGTRVVLGDDEPLRAVELQVVKVMYFSREIDELEDVSGRLHLRGIGGDLICQGDALME